MPPLALVAPARGRLLLAAVDAVAAGEGLAPGQPLAEARALVPDLVTAPHDPAGDAEALARLAEWCGRYTPWTAIDGSPDPGGGAGILLDVTGCAHLFAPHLFARGDSSGEAALLADLIRRLGRFGFAARAALAPGPGAAWALARFGAAGRDPWTLVQPDAVAEALAPLPPAALRLAPATCDLLARLGLRRIGDLYGLPPATLAPRFGPSVARRLAQALGREAEPISPRPPAAAYLARRIFAEPIATPEDIARALEALLNTLARCLETDGRGARRLELGLYRVDGSVRRLALGTSRARRDPAHLGRLFAVHLDKIDPGFGIEVMTLAAPVTESLSALQMVLSDERAAGMHAGVDTDGATHEIGLPDLVDRLGNRLGLDNVFRPAPRQSHVPERAVAAAPALEEGADMARWSCPLLRQAQDEDRTANARPHPKPARGAPGASIEIPPTLTLPLKGGGNQGSQPSFRAFSGSGGNLEGRSLGPRHSSPSPSMGEGRGGGDGSAPPWTLRPRPLRLLPRPEPVEAIALLPDHAPARFRWRRLTHGVVRAEGPERIEPEWWLEPAEVGAGVGAGAGAGPAAPLRDYFRVEVEDGRRYWLYRAAGRWFLHGIFA